MHRTPVRHTLRVAGVIALAVVPLVAAACSSDDSSSTTTTTAKASTTTTPAKATGTTVRFDKSVQTKLKEVGCYSGNVDGIMGPETDAAIVAFQTAAGLSPDGELGPETDAKLTADAAAGTKVCGSTTSTTTPKTTTTTGGSGPACTATAISAALPAGEKVTSYVCIDGYAAGGWTNGQADGAYILQAESGKWVEPGQDPCGSASAGLPPQILQDGCAS